MENENTTRTATVTLIYYLSEAGRKASLLAGGNGREVQQVQLPATPDTLALADVDANGHATIHAVTWRHLDGASYVVHGAVRRYRISGVTVLDEDQYQAGQHDALDAPPADPLAFALDIPKENERRRLAAEAEVEKERAEQVAREAERVAANAAKSAELESMIERLAGEEGDIDTPTVTWVKLDGRTISWSNGDIPSDLQERLNKVGAQRRDQKLQDEAAKEASRHVERDAWIQTHGSPRLQKGLAAGLIDKMTSVYRDERIAHDLGPDWSSWQVAPEPKMNDRLNPTEAELDALAEAVAKWPTCDVVLKSVGGVDKHDCTHPWRPALLLDCPWDADETAIRYLGDAEADDDSDE